MAKYKIVKGSKAEFSLKLEEKALEKAKRGVLSRLKDEVNIKGFRDGHAPEAKIIEQVGLERIFHESLNSLIDKAYIKFAKDEKLAIVGRPEVDIPEKMEFPLEVKFSVEVYPTVKLGDYKKIKVTQKKVEVKDKEVEEAIRTACAQLELGKEVARKCKKQDLIEVNFVAKDDKGEEIPNTKGEHQKFRLGMGHYLPDLEKAFEGMKEGESKDKVKVKFPKDYQSKDMAGKTILFDIKLHKVFEISIKDLTDEDVEKLSGEKKPVKDLLAQVKENMLQNKKRDAQKEATDQYTEKLVKVVEVDLPQSWIDREVENKMNQFKSNPQFQQNPEIMASMMQNDGEMKKSMATQGEKDLKVFLGLSELVKSENIELDKDEMEQAHHMAHQALGQEEHHHGQEHDQAMEKAILDMQIDKFLRTAIMEG